MRGDLVLSVFLDGNSEYSVVEAADIHHLAKRFIEGRKVSEFVVQGNAAEAAGIFAIFYDQNEPVHG